MQSRKGSSLKLGVVIVSMMLTTHARANEEAAATGPGGSGFTLHVSKIANLKKETDELEEQIKKLIEEKREAHDETAVRNMTLEIAEKYRSLEEASDKLEEEQVQVRFHYPEQTQALERKYVRFKKKSMKDLEAEAGIDGRLDRIRDHVLATFPVPEIDAKKNAPPNINPVFLRKPASVDDEDVPEKIILKK